MTTAPDITARDTSHNGVTLNPDYGVWIGDRILPTYIPGGFWAVKVRRHARIWIAYAVPRSLGVPGVPFLIATSRDFRPVLIAAIRWRDSAATLVMRMDRIVFAGTGNATLETLPGFDPASLLAEVVTV